MLTIRLLSKGYAIIVVRHGNKIVHFIDKSMKIDTEIDKYIIKRYGYGGIANF